MTARFKSRTTWYSIVLIVCFGILLSGCGGGESSSPQEVSATTATELASPEAETPTAAPKPTATPVPLPTKTAKESMTSGDDYFDQDDWEKAIAEYTQAIALAPDMVDAYIARGNAYAETGRPEEALADFSRAIELEADNAVAYGNRGRAYKELGNFDQAVADLNKSVELDPNYATGYYNLGVAHEHTGEIEQAIVDYSQTIEIDPAYVEAYNNRGLIYYSLDDDQKAIADFQQVLALSDDPNLREQPEAYLQELSADSGAKSPSSELTVYTNDALGLSFQYPSGWAVTEDTNNFAAFVGVAPDESLFQGGSAFEQDVGIMVILFRDLGAFNDTDLNEIQDEFMYNSFVNDLELVGQITPLSIPGPEGMAIEGIAGKYKGIDIMDGETTLLLDITTIVQGGRAGIFVVMMTEAAKDEYWPALQSILSSLDIQLTPPEQIVNTIFEAARTQDFALVKDLCDPEGENDDDTQVICEVAADETNREDFVKYFGKGRLNGLAYFSPDGDMAEVPFLFGPAGDQDETMDLIKRGGQWYLLGF